MATAFRPPAADPSRDAIVDPADRSRATGSAATRFRTIRCLLAVEFARRRAGGADALDVGRFAAMGASGGGPHALRGVARRPSQRCGDARRHRSVHRGIRLVHDGVYRAQALHGRSRRPGRPRTALPQEFDENSFNAQDWAVLDGRCGRRSARTPARPARRVPRGDRLRPAVCVVRNQRQPFRAQHDSAHIGAR